MGDEADDIITGFGLADDEKGDYNVVKNKFEGSCNHAVVDLHKRHKFLEVATKQYCPNNRHNKQVK